MSTIIPSWKEIENAIKEEVMAACNAHLEEILSMIVEGAKKGRNEFKYQLNLPSSVKKGLAEAVVEEFRRRVDWTPSFRLTSYGIFFWIEKLDPTAKECNPMTM